MGPRSRRRHCAEWIQRSKISDGTCQGNTYARARELLDSFVGRRIRGRLSRPHVRSQTVRRSSPVPQCTRSCAPPRPETPAPTLHLMHPSGPLANVCISGRGSLATRRSIRGAYQSDYHPLRPTGTATVRLRTMRPLAPRRCHEPDINGMEAVGCVPPACPRPAPAAI